MTGGQAQPLEVGDRRVDAAGDQAEPAALPEQVDAEPGLIAVGLEDDVGEVDAAGLLQDGLLAGREQRKHQPFHVGAGEGELHQPQHAGQPHGRGIPTLRCRSEPLNFITMKTRYCGSAPAARASSCDRSKPSAERPFGIAVARISSITRAASTSRHRRRRRRATFGAQALRAVQVPLRAARAVKRHTDGIVEHDGHSVRDERLPRPDSRRRASPACRPDTA